MDFHAKSTREKNGLNLVTADFNKNQRIWTPFPEYYLDSWKYFTDFIDILKVRNANFVRMIDAYEGNWEKDRITIVLDHHIDHYPVETEVMTAWEQENSVISSIYLFNRVINSHFSQLKKEWSLDDINIKHYQQLEKEGFEIGYHTNAVGQTLTNSTRTTELSSKTEHEALRLFHKDLANLRKHFEIKTYIPHGGGEGNHLLPDQTLELDVIWAYNKRPKTNSHKAKWENFTDSSGQNLIIIKSESATYLVGRDHLHVKAWVARSGLHHILLHPGRFGKGMPYEKYCKHNTLIEQNTRRLSPSLLPGKLSDFPLSVPEMISDWECEDGAKVRKYHLAPEEISSTGPCSEKYYLLTNCATILRSHMAENQGCVAFYLRTNKFNKKAGQFVSRDKQGNNRFATFPIQPDKLNRMDIEVSGELYIKQFSAFFNQIFAHRPWRHLAHCEIPFKQVNLQAIKIANKSDFINLIKFLKRCVVNRTKVQIIFQDNDVNIKKTEKKIKKLWTGFQNHFETVLGRDSLLISSIVTQNPRGVNVSLDSDGDSFEGQFQHYLPCQESKLVEWKPGSLLEVPPIQHAVNLHEYTSHFFYCRRIAKSDIDMFRRKKLPEEWLKQIESKIDDHTINAACGGQLYRDYILSRPSSDLLYQYLWNTLWHQSDWSKDVNDHSTSNYSWPWSYAARAAMIAYEKTNELKYPEAIINTFLDRIAPNRDHLHNRVDQVRGRSVRSWGSNYYDEYGINKGYSSLGKRSDPRWTSNATAAGRICFPVALAIESIRLNPKSSQEFLEKSNQSLAIIKESVLEFLEDCKVTSEGLGYVERPDRNQVEALNHQNSYAEALIIVGQLAGNMELVDKGISIAKYFNASIKRLESGTLSWGYKGISALGDLKRSQRVEDIAHGQLNMSFAKFCYSRGVVFSRTDMTGFAETFLKGITQGNHKFSPRVSKLAHKSGLVLKPGYADHYLAWIQLSEFDSYIREVVEQTVAHRYDLYPRNWFGSPVSALAYAWRLEKK